MICLRIEELQNQALSHETVVQIVWANASKCRTKCLVYREISAKGYHVINRALKPSPSEQEPE